ncbi:MAG: peptidylprolyl isomerase [Acetobacteraceae bacterium]|nr:peptidylprolyl isomerase [Acetobacteraceae bacterium]
MPPALATARTRPVRPLFARLAPPRLAGRLLVLGLLLPFGAQAAPPAPSTSGLPPASRIVAVVNGDVISNGDVDNRTRLFALSTGMPMSPEVLDRLRPQILSQLVDERLRMQEVQRRKIVITDQQIATAIGDVAQRNHMTYEALRAKLSGDGVSARTLIDQIRTQLGWTQVIRDQLAERGAISDTDVEAQQRVMEQQVGKQQYRVGEIFIPVDDPANTADVQRFAETVISELRAGAPFPVVAAQFSQSQTALEGGELGWVQINQLDPAVARLVTEMPPGAISNPVKVPGGFSIVTLQGKREFGRDLGTIVSLRQVAFPFTSALNPQAPTEQQKQTLEKAKSISASVHSCDQMEQVAKAASPTRPADPGPVRLETVNPPAFRQLLATLPPDRASQPLVSADGIAVLIVCSREQRNLASMSKEDVQRELLGERVELLARQLQRDLRRQSTIDMRSANGA